MEETERSGEGIGLGKKMVYVQQFSAIWYSFPLITRTISFYYNFSAQKYKPKNILLQNNGSLSKIEDRIVITYSPVSIFSPFHIVLRIQNENIICIFKLEIFNKASEKNIHHVHINLPKSTLIIPVSNELGELLNASKTIKVG